jgi:putative ABC transport system substrate-binding protein
MRTRREFLIAGGAGLCALATPLASFAQQAKVWRIGILSVRSRPDSLVGDNYGAFLKGLRELGYIEGKNIIIEWRFAEGRYERLPGLAAELVDLKVDVLAVINTAVIRAARRATSTIPIVMLTSSDPVGSGFVASLARPGGNITGLSNVGRDIAPKYVELLTVMVPKLSRVAVLLNPANTQHRPILDNIQTAAVRAGIKTFPLEAETPRKVESAFASMVQQRAGAMIVANDALFTDYLPQIVGLAARNRMPAMFPFRDWVEAGGLMSYGQDFADSYRRAATYIDKIFKGAKAAELPVEQSTKFELVINRKTATALGLAIPQELLLRADEVIA